MPSKGGNRPSATAVRRKRESHMTLDYTLAAIVSAGLLFYLTYALVRPEKF